MHALDPQDSLGFHCALTFRAFTAALEKRLAGTGVSPSQFLALSHLMVFGSLVQAELAGHLSITPASAVRLIDRMERDGWVERQPDRQDRRVKRVVPTKEAASVWDRISALGREVLEQAYRDLPPVQIEAVKRVLLKLRRNLEA